MNLYHKSLNTDTSIIKCLSGSFTKPKTAELLLIRSSSLEIMSIDEESFKLKTLLKEDTFSRIKSVDIFKFGANKIDYICLICDSGRITILEALVKLSMFKVLDSDVFSKTGSRINSPGEYISIEPKGRSVMISSIYSYKLVYNFILNPEENRLVLSSCKEYKSIKGVTFSMVSIENDYNNPLFACLETDFEEENGSKFLNLYEMDLGLNCIVLKNRKKVSNDSYFMTPYKKGVFLFSQTQVEFLNLIETSNSNMMITSTIISIESMIFDYKKHIVTSSYSTKYDKKDLLIFHSENGKLYKINENPEKTLFFMEKFGEVSPSLSFCIMKNGFLFSSSLSGYNEFYNIDYDMNLIQMNEKFENLNFISDFIYENDYLYILNTMSKHSSLKVMTTKIISHKQGKIDISHINSSSPPEKIWSINNYNQKGDITKEVSILIVGYTKFIRIFSLSETIEDISLIYETGFDLNKETILVSSLIDNSYIQVMKHGFNHIIPVFFSSVQSEKPIPSSFKKTFYELPLLIKHVDSNPTQIILSSIETQVFYFEFDKISKSLKKEIKKIDYEITSLSLSPYIQSKDRSKFLITGAKDSIIRIYSLDINQFFIKLSIQEQSTIPISIQIILIDNSNGEGLLKEDIFYSVFVGLINGEVTKTEMDVFSGFLSNTRTVKLVEGNEVKENLIYLYKISDSIILSQVKSENKPENEVNALFFYNKNEFNWKKVNFEGGNRCFSRILNSNYQLSIGVLSLKKNEISVLNINYNQLVSEFHIVNQANLDSTPRKIIFDNENNFLFVLTSEEAYQSSWTSQVKAYHPVDLNEISSIRLENQACFSMIFMNLTKKNKNFLILGLINDYVMSPKHFSSCYIGVYSLNTSTLKFEETHTTQVKDIPLAFHIFNDFLMTSIGNEVFLYEIGVKKLILKNVFSSFSSQITKIVSIKNRIFLSSLNDSVYMMKYDQFENKFFLLVDDPIIKYPVSICLLDYNTLAVSDKHGNFNILRTPDDCNDETLFSDPKGIKILSSEGFLLGAKFKFTTQASFYIGEIVTCIRKINKSNSPLLYSTSLGRIGIVFPIEDKSISDFLIHFTLFFQLDYPSISGRDIKAYESYYNPIKNISDGDFLGKYENYLMSDKKRIAKEMERTVEEIQSKFDEINDRIKLVFK